MALIDSLDLPYVTVQLIFAFSSSSGKSVSYFILKSSNVIFLSVIGSFTFAYLNTGFFSVSTPVRSSAALASLF